MYTPVITKDAGREYRRLTTNDILRDAPGLADGRSGGATGPGRTGYRGVRGYTDHAYLEHYTERDPQTGCLLWTGIVSVGRPRAKLHGREVSARKLAWEVLNPDEPMPPRLTPACGQERCVEPTHTYAWLYTHGQAGLRTLLRYRTAPMGEHLIWRGSAPDDTTPDVWINNTKTTARRIVWEATYCPLPDGVWLVGTCDQPACVHPEHVVVVAGQSKPRLDPPRPEERARWHNAWTIRNHVQAFPGQSLHQIARYAGVPPAVAVPPLVEAVARGWITGRKHAGGPAYYPMTG